ncbi:hypothetical protein VTJ49DRAFT_7554 [Mycothermus thermophilus]|uniref:Uncharacterized protein n=1 Tax=Humicola insolens TaxID=85995 RepID=A0ABR3VI16_HUMIN
MEAQPVAVKPPPPHVSPKSMWTTKLVFRVLQAVFAIASIGCVGSIASAGWWGWATLIVILPQAGISLIWAVADAICIVARGGRRGIHPGACVAVDLLLWLGLVVGTAFLSLWGIATDIVNSSSSSYSYYYGYDDDDYGVSESATTGKALIAFGALLTVLHFVSFVIACVETHQRNSRNNVVYVQTAPVAFVQPAPAYVQAVPAYRQGGAAPYAEEHKARRLAEKRAEITETITVTVTSIISSRSIVTLTVTTTIFSTTTIAANPETTVIVTTTIALPSPSTTETPDTPSTSDPATSTPDPSSPVPVPPSLTDRSTDTFQQTSSTEVPQETSSSISTTETPTSSIPSTTSPGTTPATSTSSSSSSFSPSSSTSPSTSPSPTDDPPPVTPPPDASIIDSPPPSQRLTNPQIAGICAGIVVFLILLSLALYLLHRRAQRRRFEAIQAKLLDQERGAQPPRLSLSLPGEMTMTTTAAGVTGAQMRYVALGGNPYFPGSEEQISSISSSDESSAAGPVVATGPGPGPGQGRLGTSGTVSSGGSSRGRLGLAPGAMAVVAGWRDRAKGRLTRLRGGRRPSSSASESVYSTTSTSSALRGDGVHAVRVVVRRPGEPPAVAEPMVGEVSPASPPVGTAVSTDDVADARDATSTRQVTPPTPTPPPRAARSTSIKRKPVPGGGSISSATGAATLMTPARPLPSPVSPGVEGTGGGWSTASQRGSTTDLVGDAEGGDGEGDGSGRVRKQKSLGGKPWWVGGGGSRG